MTSAATNESKSNTPGRSLSLPLSFLLARTVVERSRRAALRERHFHFAECGHFKRTRLSTFLLFR
ncbi:hypothetical protein BT69DRAFT_1282688 [Atractiella rhizophila]|nr:hypothetical protein BT69DRAFT_1282688 [Atractiella rhizophila]